MKITNSEPFSRLEHIQKREVIPFIIRLIFSVSEINKNFPSVNKLQEQKKGFVKVKEDLDKQNELLVRISLVKKTLVSKVLDLKNENSNRRVELLNKLGVEEWR